MCYLFKQIVKQFHFFSLLASKVKTLLLDNVRKHSTKIHILFQYIFNRKSIQYVPK